MQKGSNLTKFYNENIFTPKNNSLPKSIKWFKNKSKLKKHGNKKTPKTTETPKPKSKLQLWWAPLMHSGIQTSAHPIIKKMMKKKIKFSWKSITKIKPGKNTSTLKSKKSNKNTKWKISEGKLSKKPNSNSWLNPATTNHTLTKKKQAWQRDLSPIQNRLQLIPLKKISRRNIKIS